MRFICSARRRADFRAATGIVLVTLLGAVGCGKTGDVTGKVTYKGKALVWGTVQFEGSDNLMRQSNIKPDGSFSVRGVAVGEAKAAVSSRNPKSDDFQPRVRLPKGAPANIGAAPSVKGWFPIPAKYETPFESGLTYTIKSGQNEINIELN